jgi:hypothetical protein
MTNLGMKTSVWSATHVRLLCQKTWEFHTWILSFNDDVYMPLDQDKIERSNSFPRFRWELGSKFGKFLLYTHPLRTFSTSRMIPLSIFLPMTSQIRIFITLQPSALTMGLNGCRAIGKKTAIVLVLYTAFIVE